MKFLKFLRWAAITIGIVLGVLLAASAAVILLGISINLNPIRGAVETAASEALDRNVRIEGPIELIPTLWPILEVHGLWIGNPRDWEAGEFVRAERLRGQLGIVPLLGRKIVVTEMTAEGVQVSLEKRADGEANWVFTVPKTQVDAPATPAPSGDAMSVEFVEVQAFALRRVTVNYLDGGSGKQYVFALTELVGSAPADEPSQVTGEGSIEGQPYSVALTGDRIAKLLAGAEPWRFNLSAKFLGASLALEGDINEPLVGKGINVAFSIAGDKLEDLGRLTDAGLPPLGPYEIAGRLAEFDEGYELSAIRGSLGGTAFAGEFAFSLAGTRPRVWGTLGIGVLDAAPLLSETGRQDGRDPSPSSPALGEVAFSFEFLRVLNADVQLTVDEVVNAPVGIRDASLALQINDGELTAPMAATIAEVPFRGTLVLTTVDTVPQLTLLLTAEQTEIGQLAGALTSTEGIEGRFERLEVRALGRGSNLRSVIENLDLRFAIGGAALSYGNYAGGKPVGFTLDVAEVTLDHGQAMLASARGTLLDEPFSLEFSGGSLAALLDRMPWPLDLSGRGAGVRLHLVGTVVERTDTSGPALKFALSGHRIGDLAAWVGVSPSAQGAFSIRGEVDLTATAIRVTPLTARFAQTTLSGDLAWTGIGEAPLLVVAARIDTIDPDEFRAIFESKTRPEKKTAGPGVTIDMPIVPTKVAIIDADIELTVDRVALHPTDLTQIVLSSRFRDGRLEPSPFQVVIEETLFKGQISADLRGEVPEATFDVASEAVDIGELFRLYGIAEGVDARAERLSVNLTGRGYSIAGILSKSEFSASVTNGSWTLHDRNTQDALVIQIVKGKAAAAPGEPITVTLDGRIDELPVSIEVRTDPLAAFMEPSDRLPLTLSVEAAGARLELKGRVPVPIRRSGLEFTLKFAGERLDSLNELVGVALPPIGPYALGGRFEVADSGYYLPELDVQVGESTLRGHMSFETAGARPRLDIALSSGLVQMNDFEVGDWSLFEQGSEEKSADAAREQAAMPDSGEEEPVALLSPQAMQRLDARLAVQVEQVLSGQDKLGSGTMTATLEAGRFSLTPFDLQIPGGSINLAFGYEPTETDVTVEVKAQIEHFDYGILARKNDPETDMGGWFSLHMDLASRAESLDTIMQHANGYLDFAIWPENIEAGVFDLWAVNLLVAVLPRLESENQSKVNCLVARFNIEDGVMRDEVIMVDTTKVVVNGEGKVNFQTEEVDVLLVPNAKTPQFFSLATPLVIEGTFSDFGVGVSAADVFGTVVRFVTSAVVVPIKRLTEGSLPEDGEAACKAAMQREAE
ncbi:MAG: AsmA family protein [Gammaproteobacteria bacterium]